jgi:glycosyltransferase involved in cell wall biosynthesis
MPEFGWRPIILTVKRGAYPALDYTLANDIPKECLVFKSNSFEPDRLYKTFTGMQSDESIPVGVLASQNNNWKKRLANRIRLNLFIPDAKLFWKPFAVRLGKQIIKKEKPDIIFSSSPPPTAHLIAKHLAKWSGIKWAADFRDPWTGIHYYYDKRSRLAHSLDSRLEAGVLKHCDRIVCVSRQFANLLQTEEKDKIEIIYNGYDESDFNPHLKKSESFKIVHIGGLNWNRYYPDFFIGFENLLKKGKIESKRVELILAGSIEPAIADELQLLFSKFDILCISGYVSHEQAVEMMCEADLLLLFLEKVQKYEGHIPGKLFEYLATGNYILGVGSKSGDSAKILSQTNAGRVFNPGEDAVPEILEQYRKRQNNIKPNIRLDELQKFSRRNLTKQLINIFEDL